ncbi:NfeD family protein [bacterium]|nr:NfeD family protein [bacterium]
MEFLKDFFTAPILWFFAGIVMLILEFALPGLIIFFFGVGACIVGILCLIFDLSLNAQLIIFIVTSIVSLFSLRKWLKRVFQGKTNKDSGRDVDDFAGEKAVVTKSITPKQAGTVEFHGTEWKAVSDVSVKKGATVVIVSKESITLKVKPE